MEMITTEELLESPLRASAVDSLDQVEDLGSLGVKPVDVVPGAHSPATIYTVPEPTILAPEPADNPHTVFDPAFLAQEQADIYDTMIDSANTDSIELDDGTV